MTQKEAVVKALKKLGGQSHLTEIYILAKAYIGDSSSAQQIEANIRRELNTNHALFCHVEGMPDGWWQLKSYQDETGDLESKPLAIGGGTYAKEADNVVAFGMQFPGWESNMHSPGEAVKKEDLFKGMAVYARAIMYLGDILKK